MKLFSGKTAPTLEEVQAGFVELERQRGEIRALIQDAEIEIANDYPDPASSKLLRKIDELRRRLGPLDIVEQRLHDDLRATMRREIVAKHRARVDAFIQDMAQLDAIHGQLDQLEPQVRALTSERRALLSKIVTFQTTSSGLPRADAQALGDVTLVQEIADELNELSAQVASVDRVLVGVSW